VKAEILRRLLEAHVVGDNQAFRKAALQLAATEGDAGHTRIAEELRAIIARMPVPSAGRPGVASVDIAQPRGELAGLLTGGYRQERLKDIVLPAAALHRLERVLREHRHRPDLEAWGVGSSRKLLFHGPPGCGKTLAASVIAGEIGLPLMTVRFDGLFSRFLGATAGHLKVIFDEMPRRPAVYLFDEFDAVAKSRGDAHEVGEIRRVVTSFLQLMDADQSGSIIIAATNFEELLDRAVFRRFDVLIAFAPPTGEQLERLIRLRLQLFVLPPRTVRAIARQAVGLSFADAARACDDAIRTMVLDGRRELADEDLVRAFDVAMARTRPGPAASGTDAPRIQPNDVDDV
jgi:SpoVK/Ycf46/Vps4 family AAA+-type ATPase